MTNNPFKYLFFVKRIEKNLYLVFYREKLKQKSNAQHMATQHNGNKVDNKSLAIK